MRPGCLGWWRRRDGPVQKSFAPDHPTVATRLNNLASLYQSQGRYAKAEPLYRRALEIDEKAFGENHPACLSCILSKTDKQDPSPSSNVKLHRHNLLS